MRIASTIPARRTAALAAATVLAGPAALPAGAQEAARPQRRAPHVRVLRRVGVLRAGALAAPGARVRLLVGASRAPERSPRWARRTRQPRRRCRVRPRPPRTTSRRTTRRPGVDEPDLVKTDGTRMFVLDGQAALLRRCSIVERRQAAPSSTNHSPCPAAWSKRDAAGGRPAYWSSARPATTRDAGGARAGAGHSRST